MFDPLMRQPLPYSQSGESSSDPPFTMIHPSPFIYCGKVASCAASPCPLQDWQSWTVSLNVASGQFIVGLARFEFGITFGGDEGLNKELPPTSTCWCCPRMQRCTSWHTEEFSSATDPTQFLLLLLPWLPNDVVSYIL